MENGNHRKLLACLKCGTDVEVATSVPKVYCPPCRKVNTREYNLSRYHRKNPDRSRYRTKSAGMFMLVSTPESREEGGYNPGAIFSRTEVALGLQMSAYAIGTVFEDTGDANRRWTVAHDDDRRHRRWYLVDCNGKQLRLRANGWAG